MPVTLDEALNAISASSLPRSTQKCLAFHAIVVSLGTPSPQATHSAESALVAHERALAAARARFNTSGGSGEIISMLFSRGLSQLAKRLRASARSRGALAHPDTTLANDIINASSDADQLEQPPQLGSWDPSSLCDDRVLRRQPRSVPQISVAGPPGTV